MKRNIITAFVACVMAVSAAETRAMEKENGTQVSYGLPGRGNLDIGLSVGSTGVGLDVSSMPVDFIRVRAGVDYMPRFNVPMRFDLDSYRDGALSGADFSELQRMMKSLSGFDVDRTIKMDCKANMVNFKLLVDFFPIRGNRHWYVTTGFYWGTSNIGSARNSIEEMPSLLAIGMFNQMHDYVLETDFIETPIFEGVYLDPDVADRLKEKMETSGRVGVHVGNHRDGRPYMMEPDKDGMVKARMIVNSFKPYLGAGYTTCVGKERRISIGVDAGAMFWGGKPQLITHENVDLVNDVVDISGKVGDYVDVVKALKVYPVLNFRIAYRL